QIIEALRKLRCANLLAGFRGAPPADIEAVAQAAIAIGRLMQSVPELTEIDVNPLMVHAKGQGVTALDALIVILASNAASLGNSGAESAFIGGSEVADHWCPVDLAYTIHFRWQYGATPFIATFNPRAAIHFRATTPEWLHAEHRVSTEAEQCRCTHRSNRDRERRQGVSDTPGYG